MIKIPYWYQRQAVDAIYSYFERHSGNPVIAMPTGTGKSVVIALFLYEVFCMWPNQRVVMATHDKRLIEQNAEELREMWPLAPVGIFSAGLKMRQANMPIVFGGVKTMVNDVQALGWRDLMIIDECHLLSPKDDSDYQKLIFELLKINPKMKVIGLTATPFRMRQGYITDGGIFSEIAYDITSKENFNRLVAEGFLCPLYPKATQIEMDMSRISVVAGEYKASDVEDAAEAILYQGMTEYVREGDNRGAWLVFTQGIKNAEHATSMLHSFGIDAACVHSKKKQKENDEIIRDYRAGRLRCIVNNGMLTTGFNYKPIDYIGMFRATLSPGLWVQMLGRGTRMCSETNKINCKVMDFAGNARRLGPINNPRIPGPPGTGGGDAPVRICERCNVYNHASARHCGGHPYPTPEGCGYEFSIESKLFTTARTDVLIESDAPIEQRFLVRRVLYHLHKKIGKPDSVRVEYISGLAHSFSEWILVEHGGPMSKRARDFWRQRAMDKSEPPMTTFEFLQRCSVLKQPVAISVHVNQQIPKVTGHEF